MTSKQLDTLLRERPKTEQLFIVIAYLQDIDNHIEDFLNLPRHTIILDLLSIRQVCFKLKRELLKEQL